MVLKNLKIFGFKSFAEKTELEFGSGITAIVGPNGCGKSNVIDAIRWVFGEQKASMLRSSTMQDIIFSGTEKRAPLNMAEVTLGIHNTKGILASEHSTVSVTRRVYRSGESEYRLNNVPCRLRDIQSLFLDTATASSAYTTIENKMIDAILSDKAEDRRALFEEAAGVGKYKQRRKETLRKLEYTTRDLNRISDKMVEKQRYVSILKRQVDQAVRFRKWYDECKALELALQRHFFLSQQDEERTHGRQVEQLQAQYDKTKAAVAQQQARVEEMKQVMLEKQQQLEEAGKKASETNTRITEIDKRISLSQHTIDNMKETIARCDRETTDLDEREKEKKELIRRFGEGITSARSQLQQHEEELVRVGEKLAVMGEQIAESKRKSDELSRQQLSMTERRSGVKNERENIAERVSRLQQEKERISKQLDEQKARISELEEHIAQNSEECTRLEATRKELSTRLEELSQYIEKHEQEYARLLEEEKKQEAQVASLCSQRDFLEKMDARFEGFDAGVKHLMQAQMPGMLGTIADIVSITDRALTDIVDNAIRPWIQTVVFDTDQNLFAAKQNIEREQCGMVQMISLETVSRKKRRHTAPHGTHPSLREYIHVPARFEPLADIIFSEMFIASDFESAYLAADAAGIHELFITPRAHQCRGDASVIAGCSSDEDNATGILARKQQLTQFPARIEIQQKQCEETRSQKQTAMRARDDAKKQHMQISQRMETLRQQYHTKNNELDRTRAEYESLSDACAQHDEKIPRIKKQIEEAAKESEECEQTLHTLTSKSEELEKELGRMREESAQKEKERQRISEHKHTIDLKYHAEKNKIQQNTQDIKNLENELKSIAQKREQLQSERVNALQKIESLTAEIEEAKKSLQEYDAQKRSLDATYSRRQQEYNQLHTQVEEIREVLGTHNESLQGYASQLSEFQSKRTRAQEHCRSIRERMFEKYSVDVADEDTEIEQLSLSTDETKEKIERLQTRLQKLQGKVNMAAPEEYEENKKELDEITAQRDDLQSAVDDMQKAIRTLNQEARKKFLYTFNEAKKNFAHMFTRLFEGGEVQLNLEEGADPLDAAIMINARPPGKRMRGVQLLSGGERALTAISLLFALYMTKPSTYCILDELDAPLDDANVERFVRVVNEFADNTQFIIITHNKLTIEAADLLYGVTQQEKGVSQLVSVKVKEAMRYAA